MLLLLCCKKACHIVKLQPLTISSGFTMMPFEVRCLRIRKVDFRMRPVHRAVHIVCGIRRRDVSDSDNTPLAALDSHRPDQPLAHAVRKTTSRRPRSRGRLRYPMAERILPRVEMQRVARSSTTLRSGRYRL
jgi:hypothetical protein